MMKQNNYKQVIINGNKMNENNLRIMIIRAMIIVGMSHMTVIEVR